MNCVVAKLSAREIIGGIEVDIDGTISAITCTCPFTVGMVISSVNNVGISNRSDLKAELAKFRDSDVISVRACSTVSAQVQSLGVAEPKEPLEEGSITVERRTTKDEFDMDSDEETSDLKPRTAHLPVGSKEPVQSTELNEAAVDVCVKAFQKSRPGGTILLFCEGYNPAVHMEAAAVRLGTFVMFVDATQRMKTKQRIDDIGGILSKSLAKGAWVFVENATKSITLLEKIGECIEIAERTSQIHSSARIFLMCEPHPHFPVALISNSIVLHVKQSGDSKVEIDCDDLSESRKLTITRGQTAVPSPAAMAVAKKKVRMNTQVSVVQIEGNAFMELSASAAPPQSDLAEGCDHLRRVARYRLGPSEKLISLCRVEPNRFAIGSSGGYVSVLDRSGLPLVQFRPHKACLWDIKFVTQTDFATASEDGSSSIFRFNVGEQELETLSVASFESDVFAVTYAVPTDPAGPVLSGGLNGTVCALHSDRGNCTFIPWTTSIQAMTALPSRNHVIIGGGDGTVSSIDVESLKIVDSTNRHTKKVPAICSSGSSLVTGGFDKSLRLWDMRKSMQCTHNLVMHDVVTAVAVSEKYVVACSGSSLCLWDIRNLHQLLAIKTKAWNGLTRGLVVDEDAKLAVTASVDGFARFWEIS
jgi:WD40 repeat protein